MDLLTSNLKAFEAVAKLGSLSAAALALGITQPALTRRIQSLESDLMCTLLIRDKKGARLTEEGQTLLKHVHSVALIGEEMLFELSKQHPTEIGGMIRIASYSSILMPVIAPCLGDFFRQHPNAQVTYVVKDLAELHAQMLKLEADLVISDTEIDKSGIANEFLGYEQYVAIESREFRSRDHVYLDTAPLDPTTEQFFKIQKSKAPRYVRSFMSDEAGVLLGVELGMGRGIKSKHMIPADSKVRIQTKYKSLKKPVYLHYHEQPYYTNLQKGVIDVIRQNFTKYLKQEN